MTDKTIVEYSAEREAYHCGYCDSPYTKYTHGLCCSICNNMFIFIYVQAKLLSVISIRMLDRLL